MYTSIVKFFRLRFILLILGASFGVRQLFFTPIIAYRALFLPKDFLKIPLLSEVQHLLYFPAEQISCAAHGVDEQLPLLP